MSIKFVIDAYVNYGTENEEKDAQVIQELTSHVNELKDIKIEYSLKDTNHGIGADLPTVLIEIVKMAGWAFFVIPALHKTIRETIQEWKKIKQNIDKVIDWIKKRWSILVYPEYYALLHVLESLEQKTNIMDLKLIQATEIVGKADTIHEPSIENAMLLYYLFIFVEDNEKCFIVLTDSSLNFIINRIVGLDQRYKDEIEKQN